jgi:hypothetical protein
MDMIRVLMKDRRFEGRESAATLHPGQDAPAGLNRA